MVGPHFQAALRGDQRSGGFDGPAHPLRLDRPVVLAHGDDYPQGAPPDGLRLCAQFANNPDPWFLAFGQVESLNLTG